MVSRLVGPGAVTLLSSWLLRGMVVVVVMVSQEQFMLVAIHRGPPLASTGGPSAASDRPATWRSVSPPPSLPYRPGKLCGANKTATAAMKGGGGS